MGQFEIRRSLSEYTIERLNNGVGQAATAEGITDMHPLPLPADQELEVMTGDNVDLLIAAGATKNDIVDRVIGSRDNSRSIDGTINHVFMHEVCLEIDTQQPDDKLVLQAAKEILDDPMSVAIDKIMINLKSVPSNNYASRPLVMLSREYIPTGRPLYRDRSQLLLVGWKVQNRSEMGFAKTLRRHLASYVGEFNIEPMTYTKMATAAEEPV